MNRLAWSCLCLPALLPAAALAQSLVLAAPDAKALAQDDARRARSGEPYRFAAPAPVAVDAAADARWRRLPDGRRQWRLEVACPGCLSLNLGFTRFRLPEGASLEVATPGDARPLVFTAADNADHGQLWTPVVPGDAVTVSLTLPAGGDRDFALALGTVGRGYRAWPDPAGKSGDCNVDVACPEADPWRDEVRAVGVYTVAGSWTCSGVMVNNARQDGTPYFLTADHCDVDPDSAPSVVVYWNFESSACGQHGGGSLADFQSGAHWRASHQASDFTLIELDDRPAPAFGVTYAGWDAGDAAPDAAVAIHHPSTDEKSISFEHDPLTITSYMANTPPGNGTHLRVADWDTGTTEPGSSGSPLFDAAHRVVGQLHGGHAACGNDLPDWYGRLAVSWQGGGTSSSRLRDWLDPDALGVTALDLLDPVLAALVVEPPTGVAAAGPYGGPFAPAAWTYTLRNDGEDDLAWTAAADVAWLTLPDAAGSLAPGASVPVTVALAPAATALAPGSHHGAVTFGAEAQAVVREVVLEVAPPVLALRGLAPNPATGEGRLRFDLPAAGPVSLAIHDLAGRRVWAVRLEGSAGGNSVPWTGRAADGARLPAGAYVARLATPWGEVSATLTLLP